MYESALTWRTAAHSAGEPKAIPQLASIAPLFVINLSRYFPRLQFFRLLSDGSFFAFQKSQCTSPPPANCAPALRSDAHGYRIAYSRTHGRWNYRGPIEDEHPRGREKADARAPGKCH